MSTLWEIMQPFIAGNFTQIWFVLGQRVQMSSLSDPRNVVPSEQMENTKTLLLAPLKALCDQLELVESGEMISRLRVSWGAPVSAAEYQWSLNALSELMMSEMGKGVYVSMERITKEFFNHPAIFGLKASRAFPSASADAKEAGNCIACGCNTAAVFHLMRAAEIGLRALASDRRVKIPKKIAVEFATWEEVIRQLEAAESAIMHWPKTSARDAQFAFYHGAMMELRAFKNAFRNQVMHTRSSYNAADAMAVFIRVQKFMEILAGAISETKRTPKIWRKTYVT